MAQVVGMIRGVGSGRQDAVEVDKDGWDPMKVVIHQPLEGLGINSRPKGILRNSHRPKGVIVVALGTSSGAIVIWWCPRMKSTLESTV